MKKLLSSLMVACLMFVATISTVGAVGSITADEQKIIDALEAGVTVDGVKVNLKAADINAAKNPNKTAKALKSVIVPISLSWTTNAPKIAGIDNIKLNLAANSLSNPITSPAAIVVPERESPGNIAHAWPNPINIDSLSERFDKSTSPEFNLWDK